jgi:hypothetical protein
MEVELSGSGESSMHLRRSGEAVLSRDVVLDLLRRFAAVRVGVGVSSRPGGVVGYEGMLLPASGGSSMPLRRSGEEAWPREAVLDLLRLCAGARVGVGVSSIDVCRRRLAVVPGAVEGVRDCRPRFGDKEDREGCGI